MTRRTLALGLALASLSLPAAAWAHGVGYRQSPLPSVPLEFFYSTGERMSYREARVFSPSDEKFANQTGRTDAGGRFAFIPDAPGPWKVIVRDEEGHQASAEVEITQEFLDGGAPIQTRGEGPADLYIRAGLGVSLIFNIAAWVSLARRGKAA